MTEPDEALLWAREQSVQFWESLIAKGLPPETVAAHVALARSGGYDSQLEQEAEGRRNWLEGYRAGQAASAETVKALEHIAGAAQQRANDHGEQLLDAYERIKALEEALRKQIALHNSPIINQHLINAARLEGIRLGLEAAAREAVNWAVMPANFDDAIRLLDPATIAKEADREP